MTVAIAGMRPIKGGREIPITSFSSYTVIRRTFTQASPE